MSDEEKSYTETSHIMFVKEQVLRFAAPILHEHTREQLKAWLGDEYPPKNHASSGTEYGKGTTTQYGHLKVNDNIASATDNSMPASVTAIINYVTTKINEKANQLINQLQEKLIIDTVVNSSSLDEDETSHQNHVPTSKAVWNALSNYKDLLIGVDLARPLSVNKDINQMRDAGYFKQTGARHFSYGGETIHYKNALIKVEKQSNRVIQHVYATSKVTSNGQTTYKINGSEYTRWGTSENNWGAWHVAHKPYTKTTRVNSLGTGVDTNSVVVYENTAGFIIHWDQHAQEKDKYPISANLYEYATVCTFQPPLPIKGPYVFGNLIGRMDVKITSDKMQIRSNVSKGGRIIEMHETYFVPRNQ